MRSLDYALAVELIERSGLPFSVKQQLVASYPESALKLGRRYLMACRFVEEHGNPSSFIPYASRAFGFGESTLWRAWTHYQKTESSEC